jgi:hypothetical protein
MSEIDSQIIPVGLLWQVVNKEMIEPLLDAGHVLGGNVSDRKLWVEKEDGVVLFQHFHHWDGTAGISQMHWILDLMNILWSDQVGWWCIAIALC